MEADKVNCIIVYHSFLFTEKERLALKHLQLDEKLSTNKDAKSHEQMRRILLQQGALSEDAAVLALLQDGPDAFSQRVAERIYAECGGEALLNNCPVCNRLTRTPQARQCRYCGSSWR